MIVFRYLAREVLGTLLAVCLVLLLIILSGRFVRYLAEAAEGKLDATVLVSLIGFRLPSYLELIIPLALFIAFLLAYGRLYVDNEMSVLSACGMSENRLLAYSLALALAVAAVVASFSLYLGPLGAKASLTLIEKQRSRTEFESLKPAQFHKLSSGGVSYADSLSSDKKQLQKVFMASPGDGERRVSVMTAQSGETLVDKLSGRRYLMLSNGFQYHGTPGDANFEVVSFRSYAQYLPETDYHSQERDQIDATTTGELWRSDSPAAMTALTWRLSMPLLVVVVTLLAIPLCRTQPRQGRYSKMIPAILLYVIYLVLCNAARGLEEEGRAPVPGLLLWVHGAFASLGLLLYSLPGIVRRSARHQARTAGSAAL